MLHLHHEDNEIVQLLPLCCLLLEYSLVIVLQKSSLNSGFFIAAFISGIGEYSLLFCGSLGIGVAHPHSWWSP
jgi:hypothetical protein